MRNNASRFGTYGFFSPLQSPIFTMSSDGRKKERKKEKE
jgi:hypothetical protein